MSAVLSFDDLLAALEHGGYRPVEVRPGRWLDHWGLS